MSPVGIYPNRSSRKGPFNLESKSTGLSVVRLFSDTLVKQSQFTELRYFCLPGYGGSMYGGYSSMYGGGLGGKCSYIHTVLFSKMGLKCRV